MKFISNKNQPFNLRIETVISSRAYQIYLEKILQIKGWVNDCCNRERAKVLLDAMLILEQQNEKCILHDFELLWAMLFQSSRYN